MVVRYWIAGMVLVTLLFLGPILSLFVLSIIGYIYGACMLMRSGDRTAAWTLLAVPLLSIAIALIPLHHRYDASRLIIIGGLWFAPMLSLLVWSVARGKRWGLVAALPLIFVPVIMLIFTGSMA